jgi:tRNA pseudouridine65 synthase
LPTDLPLNDQPPHAAAGPELLHLLHQDDDMVVVYKPAGWLVHRTALARHETRFVLQHLRDQIGRHVWPVHRLDQGTCGVLVFGLHKEATQKLTAAFAEHRAHKHYLALARGGPGPHQCGPCAAPRRCPPDAPAQPAQTLLRGWRGWTGPSPMTRATPAPVSRWWKPSPAPAAATRSAAT